jgi:hypothetical protein
VSNSTSVASSNPLWITGVNVTSTDTSPVLQTCYVIDSGGTWYLFANFYFTGEGSNLQSTIYYSYYSNA